jgi:uncharacterized membrane protein
MNVQQGVFSDPTALATGPQGFLRLSRFFSRFADLLLRYWAHAVTVVLGIIVALAISVALLFYLGLDQIARPIYFSLHLICAQVPSHSFYIFGHPLGLCERNFSIYTSMFVGSLIFVLSKRRLPGIPWWLWLLMLVPIALDGFTQLFGLRESSPELRVITGTLFGLGNVLFVLPLIERNLSPERQMSAALQLRRVVSSQQGSAAASGQPAAAVAVEEAAAAQMDVSCCAALVILDGQVTVQEEAAAVRVDGDGPAEPVCPREGDAL